MIWTLYEIIGRLYDVLQSWKQFNLLMRIRPSFLNFLTSIWDILFSFLFFFQSIGSIHMVFEKYIYYVLLVNEDRWIFLMHSINIYWMRGFKFTTHHTWVKSLIRNWIKMKFIKINLLNVLVGKLGHKR